MVKRKCNRDGDERIREIYKQTGEEERKMLRGIPLSISCGSVTLLCMCKNDLSPTVMYFRCILTS